MKVGRFNQKLIVVLVIAAGLLLMNKLKPGEKQVSLSMDEFKAKLKADSSLVVLDVRNPDELLGELGKIDKAVTIPLPELESRIAELNKFKDREIAVICRSGNRSRTGTQVLRKNGFNAVNVSGGMIAFRKTN